MTSSPSPAHDISLHDIISSQARPGYANTQISAMPSLALALELGVARVFCLVSPPFYASNPRISAYEVFDHELQ